MSKDDARESLERQFDSAQVIDLKRRGDKWVATLLEPKHAEFPPKEDDDSSEEAGPPTPPSDEGDDSEDGPPPPDGPPSPDDAEGDGPPKGEKKENEGHELHIVMDILTAIADKLGVVPGMGAPGADDPMGAGGPPGGPPGPPMGGPPPGPPGGAPNEILHKTKLKPGEVGPGGTPIGAPAFASTIARLASFDAFDDTPGKSIKQAHAELNAMYGPHGFKVRQIKRVENGQRLAAKLSRR